MKRSEEASAHAEAYEAPSLAVIGRADVLTQGPNGGPNSDNPFPHHGSGA